MLWRCKWLELRIKELDAQALIYDRELAVYNQEKQLQAALTSTDNCAARGVSLTHRSHIKAMTRRKRKKHEETCNIPLYMAQHPIFSYYGLFLDSQISLLIERTVLRFYLNMICSI